MNIQDLIAAIQAASQTTGNITINFNMTAPTDDVVEDTFDTDFTVGDKVLVCHIRHDGERVHTMGTVTEFGADDNGLYTRVTGDNGKHYRTGMHYNEERLGSMIVRLED